MGYKKGEWGRPRETGRHLLVERLGGNGACGSSWGKVGNWWRWQAVGTGNRRRQEWHGRRWYRSGWCHGDRLARPPARQVCLNSRSYVRHSGVASALPTVREGSGNEEALSLSLSQREVVGGMRTRERVQEQTEMR